LSSSSPATTRTPQERRAIFAATLLAVLVFLMVGVGGFVRLSGSGLSIPHWPLINGSLLPPADEPGWMLLLDQYHKDVQGLTIPKVPGSTEVAQFKIMFAIEYSHRALASLIGFAWLGLLVITLRSKEVAARIKGLVFSLGVLIFSQALLGGLVVLKHLPAEKVALHLGVGFIIFAMTQWTILKLKSESLEASRRNPLRRFAHIVLAFVFIQVLLGGLVAGSGAGYMMNTWPRMGDYIVPPGMWSDSYQPAILNILENKITIQFMHRWFATLVVAGVLAMALRAMTLQVPTRTRWALRGVMAIVTLQFLLGVMTLLAGVPVWMGLAHQLLGLVLFGTMNLILFDAKYGEVLAEDEIAAAQPATSTASAGKQAAHA
jgi:cytochrome c oxidase assembly protein subunit 15